MSKPGFPLHVPQAERKALRVAAAQADMTMSDVVREAIGEKIGRQSHTAAGAHDNASAVLAKASEKPA